MITPFLKAIFRGVLPLLVFALPGSAQECEPDGEVRYVCGQLSPEDLAVVPESPWVIVSTWEPDGFLSAVDRRDLSTERLFPGADALARHDREAYGSCPGMTTDAFHSHGLSLRPGADGRHALYVVRHGDREAVEVFEVDAAGEAPLRLAWTGCVVAPEGLGLNAVTALPGDGIGVTSPRTGDLWEWHAGEGWSRVPGSEGIGPNGLEVSPDGRWYYVGGYGSQSVIRLSRGRSPVERSSVEVGFHVDNVHWGPDGWLLAAGHTQSEPGRVGECIARQVCDGIVSRVVRVDRELERVEEVFTYPSNDHLPLGTVALRVGDEYWVGGVAGGQRIARIPAR